MKIYIAGGISGNLNPLWKIFLAGQSCDIPQKLGDSMKIFLAGQNGRTNILEELVNEGTHSREWGFTESVYGKHYHKGRGGIPNKFNIRILESYYYMDEDLRKLIPYFEDFLLDSGAFTFMQNSHKKEIDWDKYVEEYGQFIKDNNIKHFFELDIDPIVGIKEVERLRNKLEKITGRQCIPVWHKSRGLDYYKKMCKEYSYIAIGGIVTKEIKSTEYDIFIPLLKIAKENNCKVHGLGFTRIPLLKKYHFYSVDSTAWTTGNRFGFIYKYENGDLKKIDKPNGTRIKARETAINNFVEWVKFSEWANKYL